MLGRKKRVRKGIDSIRRQIEIHESKLENAKESEKIGLAEYYEKEIESLKLALSKKESILKKRGNDKYK